LLDLFSFTDVLRLTMHFAEINNRQKIHKLLLQLARMWPYLRVAHGCFVWT